jgi:hypothetical protein
MGAKATFRVASMEQFLRAIVGMRVSPSSPVLAEEMLRGREHSMETITIGGKAVTSSMSDYLPSCLEVVENAWIQWACILPRENDSPVHAAARKMGFSAISALGLDSGMTHMEWFEKPDGTLAIGEIAQRPPGANITRMTGLAHDFDPYVAWARATVDDAFDGPFTSLVSSKNGIKQPDLPNYGGIIPSFTVEARKNSSVKNTRKDITFLTNSLNTI